MKQALLCFLSLVVAMVSSKAFALNSQLALQEHARHAKTFLCERGFCLEKIPPLYLEEVAGYLGYVDRDLSRISISPKLDAGDTQLALVHEFTHVYRARFNPNEETWLNEGLAKIIEYQYSGVWPVSYAERLVRNPNLNFDGRNFEGRPSNYGPQGDGYMASFFLTLYLYNHFGQNKFLQKVLSSKFSGWENVLTSIHELNDEGTVQIPRELISKESILRHFAVSLWMNDMFSATYALFYLDPHFEPLSQSKLAQMKTLVHSEHSTRIQFSKEYRTSNANEVYSILSYEPFKIKTAEATDPALVYIYLFY